MKKIIVLGCGMVGSAIAADLSKIHAVTAADIDIQKLDKLKSELPVEVRKIDLKDEKAIIDVVKDFDLVIGAVPGFMGFNTLKAVITAGKDIVDISFFEEDPFELNDLAKEKNVTAIVDCGVAPGFSSIILGYYNSLMDVKEFQCMVGGLPFERILPFQYKAPFSPVDVIEEYVRPARIVENGKVIIKPALSEPELVNIDPVGTLEVFNTDGLRTLIKTMKIPDMKERTLRYPGHIEYMKFLRDSGFFSSDEIEVKGVKIKPVDVAAKLLFPQWQLREREREFTIMQVHIKGYEKGIYKEYIYKLFDEYDNLSNVTSMARTTGYTCTAAANLILNENFTRKGICPPEFIGGEDGCFQKVIAYLEERNVKPEYKLVM